MRADWMEDAACKGFPSDLFFPEKGQKNTTAKNICEMCPVRQECLEYALTFSIHYGIWGGMNDKERNRIGYGNYPNPKGPMRI